VRVGGELQRGGYYVDNSGHAQAFVVSEAGGKWGNAIEVPGTAALDTAGGAGTSSVSCASAGNCSAGGWYNTIQQGETSEEAFVVSEAGGKWGNAIEVPGTAPLDLNYSPATESVSCASAGNCSAAGSSFVVDEAGGTWSTAIASVWMGSVSCGSVGNCSAGGYYYAASSNVSEAFIISES
jgi:hypothetical protein